LQQLREQHTQSVLEGMHTHGVLEEWERELKALDPYLHLIRAKENAITPGLKPGYWHVMRIDPLGGPPTLIVLEGPDGEFREPGAWVYDKLRSMDMWNDRAMREQKRLAKQMEDAQQKRKEREDQDRQEEIMERWKAATQVRVSMSRDNPWSQNAAGRRGARG
jgi:hypothetical protein